MKSQNCPNLSMAMKALLFVFSNTVIRLSFLCVFLAALFPLRKICFIFYNIIPIMFPTKQVFPAA